MTTACPVTVWTNAMWTKTSPCARPLAAGARFCAKHEADRVRLGGAGE